MKIDNREYSAFMFDFDYTLGDATKGIVMCVNHAMEKMGFPHCTEVNIRKTVGLTLPDTFTQLTDVHDDILRNQFATLFVEMADIAMTANTDLFSDTIPTLNYLKSNAVQIGIVTTKNHYRIDQILNKFQILDLIDIIVGGEDVINAKPDPEGLLYAINEIKVPRENVMYIGDSIVDAKTARNANVDFIAVTTGTTTKEEFIPYSPKQIVSSLSDLVKL